ncbi:MAG: flagellar hook-basal body complex protein FliE [Leptospiraceae bacterium]|nr:flagellar hook-basal body complex protein FliE [Leptospiraceae bacterium]MDW7975657.1 flagellar hook-basal body complex protein FliE [Leptospiraceae bacterium]
MKIFGYSGVQFDSGFPKVEGAKTYSPFKLRTIYEKHMQITQKPPLTELVPEKERVLTDFAFALNEYLGRVEKLALDSEDLTKKSIYDPDNVDVHEIMIASQKARFALNLTKTLADGVIRAYRELTTPR